MTIGLTIDDVLTTTRTVRRRLDLQRPVARPLIEECISLALQAPNGKNEQLWHWVLVDAPRLRAKVADLYGEALDSYATDPNRPHWRPTTPADHRVAESVDYLRRHLAEVPLLVIPTAAGRVEQRSIVDQANHWGSILPAMWSFMLALRSRGLGSAWTTMHLLRERDVGDLLGIPADHTQAGLLAVGHTLGTDFKPAPRRPPTDVIGWNHW